MSQETNYIRSRGLANLFDFGIFFTIGGTALAALLNLVNDLLAHPVLRFVAAPLVALLSLFEIIATWHQASKSIENYAFAKAAMITVTGSALILAGIMVISGCTVATIVAPLLMLIAYAIKTIFEFSSAVFFFISGLRAEGEIRSSYFARATESFFNGVSHGLMTTAVGFLVVMLALSAGVPQIGIPALVAVMSDFGVITALLSSAFVVGSAFFVARAGAIGRAHGMAESHQANWVSSSALVGKKIGHHTGATLHHTEETVKSDNVSQQSADKIPSVAEEQQANLSATIRA